jgi:hypothetical protein
MIMDDIQTDTLGLLEHLEKGSNLKKKVPRTRYQKVAVDEAAAGHNVFIAQLEVLVQQADLRGGRM